jgi:hypothetical protein
MIDRLSEVVSALEAISADAESSFIPLSAKQLNWKPAASVWSVAQCLDHLIRTADEFDGEFAKVASGSRKNTFWQSYSPFTGMAGRFLINAVKTDSKKVKAPSKTIVPPSDIDEGIVERFVSKYAEVIKKVSSTTTADWKKTVVSSPFLAVMTYTLDDGYTVLVEHSKRHIRQAKRVMASVDFPK